MCFGCGENVETEEELIVCTWFRDKNEGQAEIVSNSWLFSNLVGLMMKVSKQLRNRLKCIKEMLDEPD